MAAHNDNADANIAQHDAARLQHANAMMKNMPAPTELSKNTCEMPFNHAMNSVTLFTLNGNDVCGYSVGSVSDVWLSAPNSRVANSIIHIISTKGIVNEFIPHFLNTLFMPLRSHTVAAEHNISAIHICHVVQLMNVPNAHPTSMPLKPYNPCLVSSALRSSNMPTMVAVNKPTTAVQPIMGCPHSYPPQNMPNTINSPVSALS
jgi:hypothetical protein